MDQEKFQSVTYVQSEGRVILEANTPQYIKLTTLIEEDVYFVVEKAMEKLDINFPFSDRILHLAVREITHAPVLLRLPGCLRRQSGFRVP